MSYPDDNPKTAVGAKKAPLHLVPPSAIHYLAMAFKDGARKYGPYNWRDQKVSSSVYVGAAMRHIGAWWDGENLSQDALVEHLAHVMACCAIILDAASVGMLNDDRPSRGASAELQAKFASNGVSKALDGANMDVPSFEGDPRDCPFNRPLSGLRDLVIGDVPHVRHSATSTATSQHPMAAEAERIAEDRL